MQWTNSQHQSQSQQDVYADVKTPYSTGFENSQEAPEFSLSSIQERLGTWNTVEVQDDVVSADLRPSEQTLKMSYQREYAASSSARTATRLSNKAKIAIAGYAVIVLALIIAVTLCSVYVTGAFGSASNLSAEYAVESSTLEELLAQAQEEDFAELAQRAADLGYIDAANSNTMEYTEIETRPAQNFNVKSNWFDALCDWLCGIFGG